MSRIDLNSDLGENSAERTVSDDDAMLDIVSSANVSCGFHAGDPAGIAQTLRRAAQAGVVVGAHPSYRDWENFGREALDVPQAVLQAEVEYQIGALLGVATAAGTKVSYVKPHGALYNTIAVNAEVADVVIAAIKAINPGLVVLGLAGSVFNKRAAEQGLRVANEAFADRAYNFDGTLVSRKLDGAVLHDPVAVSERMLQLVSDGTLEAIDGTTIRIEADSICVHGDSAGSVAMARAIRQLFTDRGVEIASFAA